MELTNNNKLIAEFMGLECEEERFPKEGNLYWIGGDWVNTWNMKYHTSWDWLMPVVQKCYETEIVVQPAVEGGCSGLITFPLIGLPYMESTYNAVVKFIKEYNDRQ